MRADFSKFLGPLPTDPVVVPDPEGATPLKPLDDSDLSTVNTARYQLAVQQLARQQYEPALDGLLDLFRRNRGYGDDLPRKTLVQVFDLLGNDHPLVATYRRRLYQALY